MRCLLHGHPHPDKCAMSDINRARMPIELRIPEIRTYDERRPHCIQDYIHHLGGDVNRVRKVVRVQGSNGNEFRSHGLYEQIWKCTFKLINFGKYVTKVASNGLVTSFLTCPASFLRPTSSDSASVSGETWATLLTSLQYRPHFSGSAAFTT